jgi:hypothetical protein
MQRQLAQRVLQQLPNPTQRMIRRNPLLRVEVAEHNLLPLIVSAHAPFIPHRLVQKPYLSRFSPVFFPQVVKRWVE